MHGVGCKHRLYKILQLLSAHILAGSLSLGSGFGQTGRSILTGRVTDASGAVLRAARVEIQPGAQWTFSDDQGQYVIYDLAPGDYKVTVSYVGFGSTTINVSVAAGQNVRGDAVMKV